MFYATGYRYDFFSGAPTITATGGIYLSAEALDSVIYLDEKEVTNARLFRNASYIQGIEPRLHRVHVQALGLNTWVKELPVYPYIVTEAESFNLPVVPQVRPVTKYTSSLGEAVVFVSSTSTEVLSFASTSLPILATTTKATSTFTVNPEYVLLSDLFAEKASTTMQFKKDEKAFGFSTTTSTSAKEVATTTVVRNNLALYKTGDDVFTGVIDHDKKIPHYFCSNRAEIAANQEMEKSLLATKEEKTPDYISSSIAINSLECRTSILMDRKNQTVQDFNFYPDSENLVLMMLDDGLYVVEVDDRAWQNSQRLYPGDNLMMIVYGGSIFIKDGDVIVEALTELIESNK